jgi:hypothetical protein
MIADPQLNKLIDDASMFVEQAFKHQGVIHPMWIAIDRSGEQVVDPSPVPFVNQAAKDRATMVVRAMFEFTGVTRYVFVCESWLLTKSDGIDMDAVQRDGISDHPDRQEVVVLTVESESAGLVMAWRPIIRPTKGKAKLGPLIVEHRAGMTVEGRMSSMLPRGGRPL